MASDITGKAAIIGCGYVGQEVARLWRRQGLTVTATTTSPERVEELRTVADRVLVLKGTDPEAVQDCLVDQQVVLVSVGPKRGANYGETYLGTAQTLAQVLPHTAVQQLIYTSTYSVYGQHQGAVVTEETGVEPATANGEVIAAAERTLLGLSGLDVCVLRLGGIYGPGRTLERIYSRAAGQTRPGTGDEWANWVHREDIVGGIEYVRSHSLSGIYNLVQDEIPTVKELIDRVCDRYHLAPVTWDPAQPSARPYNAKVSNAKIKAAGYQFIHPSFF
ncbi:SDR family oxidoreductase [Leptothoe sp. PORK10 BA2]|uniref:SDR family oxidoreductase n=1 Tax=Leptothoe sp. PORK10 BA2 TaxID=3110254 RepID=UPI002B20406F|nr:SDR family oxidoreductase [Leptothoe sp. PORK10 BA2]MEA5466536.1 SDR family oxidoreductase [Leptothoe sp. PORK10 BA2]